MRSSDRRRRRDPRGTDSGSASKRGSPGLKTSDPRARPTPRRATVRPYANGLESEMSTHYDVIVIGGGAPGSRVNGIGPETLRMVPDARGIPDAGEWLQQATLAIRARVPGEVATPRQVAEVVS